MASGMRCYNCGKGIMVGHNVSHAKNRTRKVFKPNLHAAKIIVGGTSMRVRLCTKCLKEVRGRNVRALKAIEKAKTAQVVESVQQTQDKMSSAAPAAAGLV